MFGKNVEHISRHQRYMFDKDVEHISRKGWPRQTLNKEHLNKWQTKTYMPGKDIGHIQKY